MSYYVRGNCGRKLPVTDLTIYTTCPRCGREIDATGDYWDLISTGIDPCRSSIYCSKCAKAKQQRGR